jgi:asparagine synthase (glutamine-hydrolysing)
MCGIAGIIGQCSNKRDKIKLMIASLKHRGPDGFGIFISKNAEVGFGHTRLSIINLSDAGIQPMHFLDRYTITYNGEIYNFIELREELKNQILLYLQILTQKLF